MIDQKRLDAVIAEVKRKHKFHTLIIYGSVPRGEGSAGSDIDLLAVRKGGKAIRDSRRWRGTYLDIFVYPEKKVTPRDFLHVRGGRVLIENGAKFGSRLLAAIDRRHQKGPPPLPDDERQVRLTWHYKTLERCARDDTEAHYRLAWMKMALLEDYFAFRQLWFEGPKRALAWLQARDRNAAKIFAMALKPAASLAAVRRLVDLVCVGRPR